jgi:hypothetical protein
MKIIAISIFLLPVVLFGQSKKDYRAAMITFQKFYNAGQGDSINALIFKHTPDVMHSIHTMWTNQRVAELHQEFGLLNSFRYIGIDQTDPDKVRVFETVFSKAGPKTTSLSFFKNGDIGNFRFITESDGINELLKKSRRSR